MDAEGIGYALVSVLYPTGRGEDRGVKVYTPDVVVPPVRMGELCLHSRIGVLPQG